MQGINLSYTVELDPDISNHRVGFELQPEHIRPIGGGNSGAAVPITFLPVKVQG